MSHSIFADQEERLLRDLWHLRDLAANRAAAGHPEQGWTGHDRRRAEHIKRWLKQREGEIQRVARRPFAAGGGWNRRHRAARFQIIYGSRLRLHSARPEHWPGELTGDLGQKALKVAETLLWVVETGHNSGDGVNKIILENGGVIGEAWCGDFAAYCYRHAGSKSVNRSWAAARLTGGAKHVSVPRPGDPVYYVFDHVELFRRDNGDGTISTVGGNTSCPRGQGVCHKVRSKSLVSHYTRVTG